MLFLDGVYADNKHATSAFHRLKAPTNDELISTLVAPSRLSSMPLFPRKPLLFGGWLY